MRRDFVAKGAGQMIDEQRAVGGGGSVARPRYSATDGSEVPVTATFTFLQGLGPPFLRTKYGKN